MIPRIIHQTFPTRALPVALEENVRHLREQNSSFEWRLYTDSDIEDFIRSFYGKAMLATYRRINPAYGAARADLFRYLLILELGGAYLDIKSSTETALDDNLRATDKVVLSFWNRRPGREHWGQHEEVAFTGRGELQQWHVIAEAGAPFLASVVDEACRRIHNYKYWVHGSGWRAVLQTTGPIMYTQVARSYLRSPEVRVVSGERELGLRYSIFNHSDNHKRLFSTHYERLSEPVVKPRGLAALRYAARRWRRRLTSDDQRSPG